ncbi:MAG: hypothetical protein QOK46_333 [Microbacteriaceae bacterium]|nr:hypothetical protein [Microbacteriaceae bacterium]
MIGRLVRASAAAWPALLTSGLSFAAYTLYSALQWRRLYVPSWDLGIFTQLLRDYASFQAPIVPIKGAGFNLLGDHFHPLLVVLAPFYAVFPSGFTLLVLQAALVAVSVFVVTRLAQEKLGLVSGLLVGLAYAASWGIQNAVAAQFHEIALAMPLLAFSLAALVRQKWLASALWAAPLVFVKEDLGLTVLLIGVVLLIRGAGRIGVALSAWGVGWFAITTLVILPALSPSGVWQYGGSSNIGGSVLHLGDTLLSLVTTQKFETIVLLVLVTGALAFRSPISLVLLPTLAWRFLSDNEAYWGPTWHYSAVLMPIAFVALIDAIVLVRRSPHPWLRRYGRVVVPITVAFAIVMIPQQPLGELGQPSTYTLPSRYSQAETAMAMVPDGATVSSDLTFMAYLASRTTVYWIGNPGNPPTDYVLLDQFSGAWGSNPPSDVASYAEQTVRNTTYQTIFSSGGIQLAKRIDR